MSGIVHKLSGTLTEIVQTATLSCRIHMYVLPVGEKGVISERNYDHVFFYKAYFYNLYIYIYKSRPRGANACKM